MILDKRLPISGFIFPMSDQRITLQQFYQFLLPGRSLNIRKQWDETVPQCQKNVKVKVPQFIIIAVPSEILFKFLKDSAQHCGRGLREFGSWCGLRGRDSNHFTTLFNFVCYCSI